MPILRRLQAVLTLTVLALACRTLLAVAALRAPSASTLLPLAILALACRSFGALSTLTGRAAAAAAQRSTGQIGVGAHRGRLVSLSGGMDLQRKRKRGNTRFGGDACRRCAGLVDPGIAAGARRPDRLGQGERMHAGRRAGFAVTRRGNGCRLMGCSGDNDESADDQPTNQQPCPAWGGRPGARGHPVEQTKRRGDLFVVELCVAFLAADFHGSTQNIA